MEYKKVNVSATCACWLKWGNKKAKMKLLKNWTLDNIQNGDKAVGRYKTG